MSKTNHCGQINSRIDFNPGYDLSCASSSISFILPAPFRHPRRSEGTYTQTQTHIHKTMFHFVANLIWFLSSYWCCAVQREGWSFCTLLLNLACWYRQNARHRGSIGEKHSHTNVHTSTHRHTYQSETINLLAKQFFTAQPALPPAACPTMGAVAPWRRGTRMIFRNKFCIPESARFDSYCVVLVLSQSVYPLPIFPVLCSSGNTLLGATLLPFAVWTEGLF